MGSTDTTTVLWRDSPSSWRNPRLAGRIPELNGIRGLAILLVLMYHYVYVIAQPADRSWQAYLAAFFRLGWSGVDLFFVLSGLLIGGILLDAKGAENYYRTFYAHRFYRIAPLYFICLLLFYAGLYWMPADPASTPRMIFTGALPAWAYPFFVQNFFVASRHTFGAIWMIVTWSLALQEQFYLLLPTAIRMLSSKGIVRLALIAIIGAPIVRIGFYLSGNLFYAPYVLLPSRMDALGLGVLLAVAIRNKQAWTWLAMRRKYLYSLFLVLGVGMVGFSVHTTMAIMAGVGYSWAAAFYASMILLVIVEPGRLERRIFQSYPLVRLGTISYGVYLFHQGINALLHAAFFGRLAVLDSWASLGVTVLALLAVLLVASISWQVFEKPLHQRSHRKFRYTIPAGESLTTPAANG